MGITATVNQQLHKHLSQPQRGSLRGSMDPAPLIEASQARGKTQGGLLFLNGITTTDLGTSMSMSCTQFAPECWRRDHDGGNFKLKYTHTEVVSHSCLGFGHSFVLGVLQK